jgi:hypothetical protein
VAGEDDEELIFDDRMSRRAPVRMAGAVAHAGQLYPARIIDLSLGGCRAEVSVDFASGMPVHVDLGDHGRFPAVVIWVEGKTIGLGFAEGVGQTLNRLGPTAAALGLIESPEDPARVIDPT